MAETEKPSKHTLERVGFQKGWSGRSGGLWGISILGLTSGFGIGAIAPFFPALVGAQDFGAAAALVPGSMAIFGTLGMGIGFGTGSMIGAASGAASGVAKEQALRNREREDALLAAISPGTVLPVPKAGEETPDERTGWEKFKDGFDTFVNFKVGALFTVLGMVAGAVMAGAYYALEGTPTSAAAMPGMSVLLGEAANNPVAVTSYFVGLMGSFGALWTFNYPEMGAILQEKASGYTSGRSLGTQWGPAPEVSQEQQVEQALSHVSGLAMPSLEPGQSHITDSHTRSPATSRILSAARGTYQELVVRPLEGGPQELGDR